MPFDVRGTGLLSGRSAYPNVELHAGEDVHLVRGTLKQLEARLPSAEFARIHRSTIVRLERIQEMHSWSRGDRILGGRPPDYSVPRPVFS